LDEGAAEKMGGLALLFESAQEAWLAEHPRDAAALLGSSASIDRLSQRQVAGFLASFSHFHIVGFVEERLIDLFDVDKVHDVDRSEGPRGRLEQSPRPSKLETCLFHIHCLWRFDLTPLLFPSASATRL
jgi:hypothetical protein